MIAVLLVVAAALAEPVPWLPPLSPAPVLEERPGVEECPITSPALAVEVGCVGVVYGPSRSDYLLAAEIDARFVRRRYDLDVGSLASRVAYEVARREAAEASERDTIERARAFAAEAEAREERVARRARADGVARGLVVGVPVGAVVALVIVAGIAVAP